MATALPTRQKARHWWARTRFRWKTRSESNRRELNAVVDVAFTAGVIISGLILANTGIAEGSKFALAVLLATLEIMWLFGRSIRRDVRKLVSDAVVVIPRDGLSSLLHEHLSEQRAELLTRASKLSDQYDCELVAHDMYRELIGLTNAVAQHRAGHATGSILAISSINIEDFEEEPLAEAYLDANRAAVARYVTVQRVFLLDQQQAADGQVRGLIERHEKALSGDKVGAAGGSGVKWIFKTQVSLADRTEDLALFAHEALVTQAASGKRVELTQDSDKILRAYETFKRLWDLPQAKAPSELMAGKRS
jgi:hypothetical protein